MDARLGARDRQRRYRLLTRSASGEGNGTATQDLIARTTAQFEQISARDKETLQQMIDYAQTGGCRWRAILDYYGDAHDMERCGVCDNCVHPPQIATTALIDAKNANPAADRTSRSDKRQPRKWAPGDDVQVQRYGAGKVALANGEQIAVQLPDGRTRTFISSYVRGVRAKPQ
ncbi:ATP-dependent DNA helicase RecQ (plasmid) [Burkholderia sp. AD24]|nr:ATP-dependent DNA helicase RecQ [Burkholderia sp. AD24]